MSSFSSAIRLSPCRVGSEAFASNFKNWNVLIYLNQFLQNKQKEITENPLKSSDNEIELRSLENDECGYTLPVFGLIIYLSVEKEVAKCVFRLLHYDADIESLSL